jgi:hypothetical protein
VVRLLPLRESPAGKSQYQKQLAEQLLDPALTVVSALKLEALGNEAIPDLKHGLQSPHPLVRFCSAESLAYLAEPACAEPLAALIEQEPRLRAYGLTALASLEESICHLKLQELLSANSAETRYGAFRALRTLDPNDIALGEERPSPQFALHQVAPHSTPLVHLSTSKRAEVILFGQEPKLVPPVSLQAGTEFVVTAKEGDEQCSISRFSPKHGTRRETCSLSVAEVVHKLAAMGAGYPDVVDFLQQAGRLQNLSCPLAVDAVPQAPSVHSLALAGARDKAAEEDAEDDDVIGLGAVPNLFALPGRKMAAR